MIIREARGTPEYLFTKKVNRVIVSIAYPEVVAYLYSLRGLHQAKADIKDIMKKVSRQFSNVWQPKPKPMKKILRDILKTIGNTHINIKILERDSQQRPLTISIVDKDCVLCPPEIRGITLPKEFPFCVAVAFGCEEALKILFEQQFPFKFPYSPDGITIKAETTASRGSGDKYCEHRIYFTFGED